MDDDELIVAYQWQDATGTTIVSGTVKLDATSAAQGSYTLGAVTVVDDPPQGAARLAGETRTALRERIGAVALRSGRVVVRPRPLRRRAVSVGRRVAEASRRLRLSCRSARSFARTRGVCLCGIGGGVSAGRMAAESPARSFAPVWRELLCDGVTPVEVYARLRTFQRDGGGPLAHLTFMFESGGRGVVSAGLATAWWALAAARVSPGPGETRPRPSYLVAPGFVLPAGVAARSPPPGGVLQCLLAAFHSEPTPGCRGFGAGWSECGA